MSLNDICVNSYYIDQHLKQEEDAEREFETIYTQIVSIFQDDFNGSKDYEELISDLRFEIGCEIDRLGYGVCADSVLKQIVDDFDIKEAE